jgi:hypothetical protein
LWVFKIHLVLRHDNGMEEWSAFHQYSRILGRLSGPIFILGQLSLP